MALECSGSTLARQGMYKRIAQWGSSLASANLAIVQSIEVARGIMPRCSAPSSYHVEDECIDNCEGADAKGGPNLEACRLYKIENLHEVAWWACWRYDLGGRDEGDGMEEGNELNPTAHWLIDVSIV